MTKKHRTRSLKPNGLSGNPRASKVEHARGSTETCSEPLESIEEVSMEKAQNTLHSKLFLSKYKNTWGEDLFSQDSNNDNSRKEKKGANKAPHSDTQRSLRELQELYRGDL